MTFKDRASAGRLLAKELVKRKYQNLHVFALPRGGVPVAFEVAKALNAPLDIIVVRKLGTPFDPELAFGAIAPEGVEEIDLRMIQRYQIHSDSIKQVREKEQQELRRRMLLYDAWKPEELTGQTAIIIDDGIATGATMLVAAKYLKKYRPAKLVIAVPVSPDTSESQFIGIADEFICPYFDEYFGSVGQYYEDFPQLTDEEVLQIMKSTR